MDIIININDILEGGEMYTVTLQDVSKENLVEAFTDIGKILKAKFCRKEDK